MSAPAADPWTRWIGRCAQVCTLTLAAGLLVASVCTAARGQTTKWTVILVVVSVGSLERLWRSRGALETLAEAWATPEAEGDRLLTDIR